MCIGSYDKRFCIKSWQQFANLLLLCKAPGKKKKKKKKKKKNNDCLKDVESREDKYGVDFLLYRIRPNYRTVYLGFSKLQEKLMVKYISTYTKGILKKDQERSYLMMLVRCLCGVYLISL